MVTIFRDAEKAGWGKDKLSGFLICLQREEGNFKERKSEWENNNLELNIVNIVTSD